MGSAKRFFVSGRVQGVFFRVFTRDAARRAGLAGTVRNLPDGRVEAYAEGTAEAVADFEQALRSGPPGAGVDRVESHDETPTGVEGFRITG